MINFFFNKKPQIKKLKDLSLSSDDWELIEILVSLLKPFYDATIQLQNQKYTTLSISYVIEYLLVEFFERKVAQSADEWEAVFSDIFLRYTKKHLQQKITAEQKKSHQVKINN